MLKLLLRVHGFGALITLAWYAFLLYPTRITISGEEYSSNDSKTHPLRIENIRLKDRFIDDKGRIVQRAWADVLNLGKQPYRFTFLGRLYLIGGKTKTDYSMNNYKIYPGGKETIGMEFRLDKDEYGHSVQFILMDIEPFKDPAFENSQRNPKSTKYTIYRKKAYLSRNPSQINLDILVPKKLSDDELISICEEIDSEYKNIGCVNICVYLDTKEGRKIAADELYEPPRSVFEQNWLAMYTREPEYGKNIHFRPWDLNNLGTKQLK